MTTKANPCLPHLSSRKTIAKSNPARVYKESSQHTARFRAGTNLPAKTGNDNNNKIAVTKIAQTNKGNLCKDIPLVLIFKVVLMKLIAPNKEDTPAKCKLKIAKSTLPPECDCILDNGG
jgi:hypothetical protein